MCSLFRKSKRSTNVRRYYATAQLNKRFATTPCCSVASSPLRPHRAVGRYSAALPVFIDQQVSWQREATLAQGCKFGGLRDGQQAIDIRVQSIHQKHSRHELAMAAHMQATADPRQVVCEYGARMGIVHTDNRPASAGDRLTGAANRGAQ